MATSKMEGENKDACIACLHINECKIIRDDLNMFGVHIFHMAYKCITLAPHTNVTVFSVAQQLENNTEFKHLLHNKAMDNTDGAKDYDVNGDDDRAPCCHGEEWFHS